MSFAIDYPFVTALFAAGMGLEAYGQYYQAQSQRALAKYNAMVAQRQAEAAKRAGEIEKYRIERRRKLMIGRQKSLYAKAGVLLKGSPLEVLADTEAQYELDKALSEYNTKLGISNYSYESDYYTKKAGSYRKMGYIVPTTSILMNSANLGLWGAR